MFNEKPNREEFQYIAVDDKNKILFCALQKVASRTWLRLLKDVLGIKGKRWEVIPRLSEYSEEEMSFKLKTYFKFFFVREPLERLLSAYKLNINLYELQTTPRRFGKILYKLFDLRSMSHEGKIKLVSRNLFSIFPAIYRAISIGDNMKRSATRAL